MNNDEMAFRDVAVGFLGESGRLGGSATFGIARHSKLSQSTVLKVQII